MLNGEKMNLSKQQSKVLEFSLLVILPLVSSVISLWVIYSNISYYRHSGSGTECTAFMISALIPIVMLLSVIKLKKLPLKTFVGSKLVVICVLLYVLLVHPLLSISIFLPIEVWNSFVDLYL